MVVAYNHSVDNDDENYGAKRPTMMTLFKNVWCAEVKQWHDY